jgi:hypothetical protein
MDEELPLPEDYDGSDIVPFYEEVAQLAEHQGQHDVAEYLGRKQEEFLAYIWRIIQDDKHRLSFSPDHMFWSAETYNRVLKEDAWAFGKQEIRRLVLEARARVQH